ncbi:MAG: phenylacetate-CoA oxygenase subunit PaaI [Bacteroidota bacterium]|jgi:ring-1,2-phenylacetyl-CoA epoxidase subunit PaaC
MNAEAIKDLLYRIGDDDLILGHRQSEWTGIGPILEEDIAFSSMAQDEIGHAQAYYVILHELFGEPTPDQIGFGRKENAFRCSKLVEYPIGDYAFSLMRHALYDIAESIRLEDLTRSSFRPLAELAKKLLREERYHSLHATTWLKQLGSASMEANHKLQTALDFAYPIALGLFEPTAFDEAIAAAGIQSLEAALQAKWESTIQLLCVDCGLKLPMLADPHAHYGGRKGDHTEHLGKLLAEMGEVYAIDTEAVW